jgi:subtilisin inhibitor-like
MRRVAGTLRDVRSAIAVAVLVAALLTSGAAAGTPATRLAISVYPNGTADSSAVEHYRLQCGPAEGTVPRPVRACRVLAVLAHPFARIGARTMCAQVIAGPQEAVVTGILRGRRITAHLSLTSSCETQRWRRVSAVVPGFPE